MPNLQTRLAQTRFLRRAEVDEDRESATFHLRDYLTPGGVYPYNELAPDLEAALAQGRKVYLISVPGFMMVSGYPGHAKPWHKFGGGSASSYRKTPAQALRA